MIDHNPDPFSRPGNDQDEQIVQEALAWFSRRRMGGLTRDEQKEFLAWQTQSPVHQQVYQEAEAFWQDDAFNRALQHVGRNRPELSPQVRLIQGRRRVRKLKRLGFGMTACLVLVTVLFDPFTRLRADYVTPVGGSQRIALSDGSTVTLNTDTAITVTFTAGERKVSLLKGEAYFDVAHQNNRPFTVRGNDSTTRVVGTRFLVKVMPDEEMITVLKGLVQVNSQEQQVLLHPNEQVQTVPAGLSPVQTLADNHEAAWLTGHISYQDQPLGQVIKELGRYNPGWVVIAGDNLKDYRISGRFNIAQPKRALDTLAYTMPVKVSHIGGWLTVISPK